MTDSPKVLQIHTTPAGEIWCTRENQLPEKYNGTLTGDMATDIKTGKYTTVKILGMRRHAHIIPPLHKIVEAAQSCRLLIASPDICYSDDERDDPVVALNRMRQCVRSSSLGGWHVSNQHDFAMYSLVDAVNRGCTGDVLYAYLQQHPVWHALSFIATIDMTAAASLLAEIIDPRWYINLEHPTRLTKLKMFLGIVPENIQRYTQKSVSTSQRYRRLQITLDTWANVDIDNYQARAPNDFLIRRVQTQAVRTKGLLKGCSTFIGYCVYNWYDKLANTSTAQHIDFFIPSAILTEDECDAYTKHIRK